MLRKLVKTLLWTILSLAALVVTGLLLFQHQLIYHPRPYANSTDMATAGAIPLKYRTDEGGQKAFYLPPLLADRAGQLWVVFSGNASLALDLAKFFREAAEPRAAFLLLDYPGYGDCEGSASPSSIEASADAAVAELALAQGLRPAKFCTFGLSLGCAASLNFAVHHPVDRMILLAPFTTMRAMARRLVSWPLCNLLWHSYDNAARLRTLAARNPPPRITILHGSDDIAIPPAMGRELAALFPAMVEFHEIPGATHNTIVSVARKEIIAAMKERRER